MESQKFNAIVALCLFSFSLAFSIGSYLILQEAQATGCPTNFVSEHIDNALAAFTAGDAKEVKNQLDLAKEALSVASEEKE